MDADEHGVIRFSDQLCALVLVECGFLSNESECTKLKDGGYQTKLAAVIIASYLQYRQSLPQTGMVT